MLNVVLKALSMAAAALVWAGPGWAAGNVALQGDVHVVRVEIVDGKPVDHLETPERVVPGDRLVFVTQYRNQADQPVENFIVTNPLPEAVKLSQAGAFEVSVDGGKTFAALSQLKVSDAGGERTAALDDVTHVRWTLARLEPGAQGALKYEAVVR